MQTQESGCTHGTVSARMHNTWKCMYVTEENKWGEGGSDTKWLREDGVNMRGSEKNAGRGRKWRIKWVREDGMKIVGKGMKWHTKWAACLNCGGKRSNARGLRPNEGGID